MLQRFDRCSIATSRLTEVTATLVPAGTLQTWQVHNLPIANHAFASRPGRTSQLRQSLPLDALQDFLRIMHPVQRARYMLAPARANVHRSGVGLSQIVRSVFSHDLDQKRRLLTVLG